MLAPVSGIEKGTPERPARFFADADDFRQWLVTHHDSAPELWMGLYKKHVPDRGLTWDDAVPEALCFGWIDSKIERLDDDAIRQRWTPRKPGSTWSTVNVEHVERLIGEGRMTDAGLAAYRARRPERTGIYAYESPAGELPQAYAAQLAADPAAAAFWEQTTPYYRRVCISWVTTAKQQSTCDRRMSQLVADSAAGRLIPSQRYGDPPSWLARAAGAAAKADRATSAGQ